MAKFAGTLLSRMVTTQFCLVWDFSGITSSDEIALSGLQVSGLSWEVLKYGTVWFKGCMRYRNCFPSLSLQTESYTGRGMINEALRWNPVGDGGSVQKIGRLS